jgi:hypothetical protein
VAPPPLVAMRFEPFTAVGGAAHRTSGNVAPVEVLIELAQRRARKRSRLSLGRNSPCPPVWRRPRVIAPTLLKARCDHAVDLIQQRLVEALG